jgi:DNA-binding IclR family transcriptional regulator
MNGILDRTLSILETLAQHDEALELTAIADGLDIPRSAAHRLLGDLVRRGYVRQAREHGEYTLTTRLASLGLSFLTRHGIVDFAQPLLERMAEASGELVRLSIVDGERLTWVARAQGARQGLRYDPDMGADAQLSCSSSGLAWMSALDDEEVLALIARQGLGSPQEYGPNAPRTLQEVLELTHAARKRGYSITLETYAHGLNAMAAPVRLAGRSPIGIVTVAGPSVRFTEERMTSLGPELLGFASQLAAASTAVPFFDMGSGQRSLRSGRQRIYAP